MRNLGQLKELKKMMKMVEKKGNVEFLSKDYHSIYPYLKAMSFATMRANGYLDVTNIEYYDIIRENDVEKFYAVKSGERILLPREKREIIKNFMKSLGYAIESVTEHKDVIRGKRYTYKFNLEKMKQDFNNGIEEYNDAKYWSMRERMGHLERQIGKTTGRLNCLKQEMSRLEDNIKNVKNPSGLQSM